MKSHDRSEFKHEEQDANHASMEELIEEAPNLEGKDMQILLQESQEEAKKQADLYLRSLADMQNLRNRFIREKGELVKTANAMLIEALLPALDSFRLGFLASEGHAEGKDVALGFKMAYDQLMNALQEKGLLILDPKGEMFDPHAHECLAQKPAEGVEEGVILEVFRVGYRLGDRLLRPANVIIAAASASS
jgi:molecular chaperone GrpE